MNVWQLILCGSIGLLVTAGMTPWLSRRRGSRSTEPGRLPALKSSAGPLSRLGGVALFFSFAAALAATMAWHGVTSTVWVIAGGALCMFAVGLWDDLRPLPARFKLAFQIVIAAAAGYGGLEVAVLKNPFSGVEYSLGFWALPVTILWLVILTNLINLIDGVDGLAAGVSLMLMTLLIYGGWDSHPVESALAAGMVGALIAFLYFNFPPAKIYMGDGGAYFLGFIIGAFSISNSQKGSIAAALIAPLLALALPILDATLAVLRRGIQGLPLFRPDQRHIHHRLINSGLSHRRTVLTLYAVSLIFLLVAFAVLISQGRAIPLIFGVIFLCGFLIIFLGRYSATLASLALNIGQSWDLRRDTRYAISLGQTLVLAAERVDTLPELWVEFLGLLRRLNFSGAALRTHDAVIEWRHAECAHQLTKPISLGNMTEITLYGAAASQAGGGLEPLADLAIEAWQRAAAMWCRTHGEAPIMDWRLDFSFPPSNPIDVTPLQAPPSSDDPKTSSQRPCSASLSDVSADSGNLFKSS